MEAKITDMHEAIGLPPRGDEFQTWRYLVDKRALDECLEGKRDLFK